MPVKGARLLPTHVLASCKVDKGPPWEELRPWCGEIEPGWFDSDDLCADREYLFAQGHMPRVAVTHKRELRKLVVQLGKERLTIACETGARRAISRFCAHFGLEYRGSTLCAAVGALPRPRHPGMP